MKRLSSIIIAACAAPALAQINISNPSFEEPPLSPNAFTTTGIPGWTKVGGTTGDWGIFYPTVGTWGYTAPHGNQLVYLNGPIIEQTTVASLTAGVTYTLCVDVVHRPNFFQQNYLIQLLAGSTVLDEDTGTLTPPVGGHLTSALQYAALPGDPLLGEPIRIRLGGPVQTNFDNVFLDDGSGCYADCDGSCSLDLFDFLCFTNNFNMASPYADCDGNGGHDLFDFLCFVNEFNAGCQ